MRRGNGRYRYDNRHLLDRTGASAQDAAWCNGFETASPVMLLKERLDLQREKMKPAGRAALQELVGRLAQAGAAERVLKPGATLPDFVLPNAEGRLVASEELLQRGPLVLTFYRGDWCPFCRLTLDALETGLPEIEAAGGQLVALSPDTGGHALETKRAHNLNYEVLIDVDSGLALACGVALRMPDAYRQGVLGGGVDLPARHGNDGWFVPLPASFVIDRTGTIREVFAEPDFTHRPEPADIVAALKRL
jgi:peroxiredoxin